jgi:hypothetical protein
VRVLRVDARRNIPAIRSAKVIWAIEEVSQDEELFDA